MTLIRNRGTVGDVLNGDSTGLVQVEGPAIFLPGLIANVNALETTVTADWPVGVSSGGVLISGLVTDVAGWAGTIQFFDDGENSSRGWRTYLTAAGGPSLVYRDGSFVAQSVAFGGTLADAPQGSTIDLWMAFDLASPFVEWYWRLSGDAAWTLGATGTPPADTLGSALSGDDFYLRPLGVQSSMVWSKYERFSGVTEGVPASGDLWLGVDIADVTDPAATAIPALGNSAGWTVARHTTGPVTTLVPAGKTVLINPDDTVTANRLLTPLSSSIDIAGTDDAVLGLMYQPCSDAVSLIYRQGTGVPLMGAIHLDNGPYVQFRDDGNTLVSSPLTVPVPDNEWYVVFSILDRASNTLQAAIYSNTVGFVRGGTAAVAPGVAAAAGAGVILTGQPGAFAFASFRKGVGIAAEYDDTTLAALAAYLLSAV